LQKAKKELMETSEATEYRLPYFWASSILVGKTDAITLQTSFEWRWIAILLLASLLLIGWWKIKPKKIVK
jgi:hypothetical protein